MGSNKFADAAREAAQKAADGIEEQTAAVRRLAAAYAESPLAVKGSGSGEGRPTPEAT